MACARNVAIAILLAACSGGDDDSAGATSAAASTGVSDASGSSLATTSAESSASSSASTSTTESGSTGAATSGSTGPGECVDDPSPPGGECPPECTAGCSDGTCRIECVGEMTCIDSMIVCPADFACSVLCMGHETCKGTPVICPADYACEVECIGLDSCAPQIQCGTASCSLHCGEVDPCTDTTLGCGAGPCTATSDAPRQAQPTVDCGDACACALC